MIDLDEMAKLHCLRSLLDVDGSHDAYMAREIKCAIEFSLTGSVDRPAPYDTFVRAAEKLLQEKAVNSRFGFHRIDFADRAYAPLWITREAEAALKSLAGLEQAVFMITGLRASLMAGRKRWAVRQQREFDAIRETIDEIAARNCTPSQRLQVYYF